jgi:hypothetical protein
MAVPLKCTDGMYITLEAFGAQGARSHRLADGPVDRILAQR